jgi:hypothetical protein
MAQLRDLQISEHATKSNLSAGPEINHDDQTGCSIQEKQATCQSGK